MEDLDQQTTCHKKPIQTAEEEGKDITEKPIQEGVAAATFSPQFS